MKRPEAILFDNDLTLCDTYQSIRGGYQHALSLIGIELTEDLARKLVSGTLRGNYQAIAGDHDIEFLASAHNKFQVDNPHLIRAFPNTRWAVEKLYYAGIKIGVPTNRHGDLLYEMIREAGIFNYLGVIVTDHDVANPKPHPEHALVTLEKLGARPENSWMVGDDDTDIACGKAAGLKTVGAMWSHPNGKVWKVQPDYLAYDIGDVVLPAIMGEQYFNQDFS